MNSPIPPTTIAPAILAAPPEPVNKFAAYRRIGLIQGIDFLLLAVVLGHVIVAAVAAGFGRMSLNFGILLALQSFGTMCLWIVLLIFRVGVFVVELRASLELMPYESARIAVGYLQGGTPLNTPVRP